MVLMNHDGLRRGGASSGEGSNQVLRIRPLLGLLQLWHSRASHTTVWNYFYPPRPFRCWGLNPGLEHARFVSYREFLLLVTF